MGCSKALSCSTASASILAAPEQTAEIAASVPKKLRQEKEGDIKKAVLRSLHLLSGLKEIVPLMEGKVNVPSSISDNCCSWTVAGRLSLSIDHILNIITPPVSSQYKGVCAVM